MGFNPIKSISRAVRGAIKGIGGLGKGLFKGISKIGGGLLKSTLGIVASPFLGGMGDTKVSGGGGGDEYDPFPTATEQGAENKELMRRKKRKGRKALLINKVESLGVPTSSSGLGIPK